MQTGVAKGLANSGCEKELEKGVGNIIAERSRQMQSQKDDKEARDADEAGNAEDNLF